MGHYHGWEGFLEFTKLRPVFKNPRFSMLSMLYPPYNARTRQLLDLFIRFKP
jgi:coniferyl-aldehyde dehydrogenase